MSENKEKPSGIDEDLQQEWINLVHGGTCCAENDPQAEEKKAFYEKIQADCAISTEKPANQ